MTRIPPDALCLAYVASVVAANWLTEKYGLVPVGFGLVVTAGTFAAGLTLLARNLTQDVAGRLAVLGLMVVGIGFSWWLASPQLAVASAVAFGLSESADMAVYSPLRRRNWSRAVLAAASVGAVIDTLVFLRLAGFPLTAPAVAGQLLVKVGISAAVVAVVAVNRAVPRQSEHRAGA